MAYRRFQELLNRAEALRKTASEMRGTDERSATLLLEEVERMLLEATDLMRAELEKGDDSAAPAFPPD